MLTGKIQNSMRIVKLVSGISLTVLGLFSCTSEELIGEQEQGDAALSVVLSVGDVSTKAIDSPATDDGYAIATADEIKVNDFYVAIFDGKTNIKIADKTIAATASSSDVEVVTIDSKPGYKVDFNDVYLRNLSTGKQVYALVITNASSLYTTLSGYDNYSDYVDEAKTAINTQSFEADKLAKAGKSDAVALVTGTTTTLTVPLTQLSARIDFGTISAVTKAGTGTSREEIEGYEYCSTLPGDAILDLIKGRIEERVIWSGDENLKKGSIDDGTWKEEDDRRENAHYSIWDENLSCGAYYDAHEPPYTWNRWWRCYERTCYYQKRLLIVRKKVVTYETETSGGSEGGFTPTNIAIEGINGKTNILMSGTERNKLASTPYLGGTIAVNTSFYTYEYPDEVPLKLTITGNTSLSTPGSSTETAVSAKYVYGILMQTCGNNGWSGAPELTADNINSYAITWYDDIIEDVTTTKAASTKAGGETTYVLNWKDLTDGSGNPVTLQHGYRYKLNVRVEQNDLQVTVVKAAWSEKDVEVNYGK